MEKTLPTPEAEKTADRRRHSRHQWVKRVMVRQKNGKMHEGTSFEISQSGMSAVVPNADLQVGERVELMPVVGYQLDAIVRRIHRNMYGFEFSGLSEEQVRTLAQQCKNLPLFRTMLDI